MARKSGTKAAYVHRVRTAGKDYFYSRVPGTKAVPLEKDTATAFDVIKALRLLPEQTEELETYLEGVLAASRSRAKSKRWQHDVEQADILNMLVRQNRCCAVSGVQFSLVANSDDPFMRAFAPSLDRIDTEVGYTKENCRLVCRIANFAMGKWGYGALRFIAYGIVRSETSRGIEAPTSTPDLLPRHRWTGRGNRRISKPVDGAYVNVSENGCKNGKIP